jgi:restriction system protein
MTTQRKMTQERVGQLMKLVLLELKAAGGVLGSGELLARAEPKLGLTDYEKAKYEKSGYIRWESVIHFYSIDCVKAGYIQKEGGKWNLTPEGEAALSKPPLDFIRSAQEKYWAWKSAQPPKPPQTETSGDEVAPEEKVIRQAAYEGAVSAARAEIEAQIDALDAYEFQKLVEELLIGMGYKVVFNAPPGADGGVDLVAYRDPFGTSPPRLKVQVKHRNDKATVKELRELQGLLNKDGDVGLLVSSGGFTADSLREARASNKHVDTMDLTRLITLWQENYDHLRESGKKRLPLVSVFFLAPTEE